MPCARFNRSGVTIFFMFARLNWKCGAINVCWCAPGNGSPQLKINKVQVFDQIDPGLRSIIIYWRLRSTNHKFLYGPYGNWTRVMIDDFFDFKDKVFRIIRKWFNFRNDLFYKHHKLTWLVHFFLSDIFNIESCIIAYEIQKFNKWFKYII